MDSVKRVRCSNYSHNEMELLITLVEEHKKIVECKKTDTVSNRDKEAEWEKICIKFNAQMGSGRSAKQLRMKWDSWKKTTRKNYSVNKCNLYKTGGGPYIKSGLSSFEERILAIIGISATGIECSFDCDNTEYDSNPSTSESASVSTEIMQNSIVGESVSSAPKVIWSEPLLPVEPSHVRETLHVQESSNVQEPQPFTSNDFEQATPNEYDDNKENEVTWEQWNPSLLKKPVHPLLEVKNMKGIIAEENSHITTSVQTNLPSTPARLNFSKYKSSRLPAEHTDTVQKSFRKRKYPLGRSPAVFNNKHDFLLDKKIELVSLQIELLKKEHEMREKRNAEKHEVEMMLLKKKQCSCNQNDSF